MARKVQAYLYMDESNYFIAFADGTVRQVETEEVRQFILTFNDPSHYPCTEPQVIDMPGMALAEVDPQGRLVLCDPILLTNLFQSEVRYISAVEYAQLYNKQPSIIYRFCRMGRIPGAVLRDRRWWIPAGTSYPELEKRGRKTE